VTQQERNAAQRLRTTMAARSFHADRELLQESARELSSQYDTMKSEAERRLGTLFNASDYPTTLDGLFDLEVSYPTIEPPWECDQHRQ